MLGVPVADPRAPRRQAHAGRARNVGLRRRARRRHGRAPRPRRCGGYGGVRQCARPCHGRPFRPRRGGLREHDAPPQPLPAGAQARHLGGGARAAALPARRPARGCAARRERQGHGPAHRLLHWRHPLLRSDHGVPADPRALPRVAPLPRARRPEGRGRVRADR
eukprot:scaffold116161_cov58-Phaeocystis_antarctica.AAC.3